MEVKYNLKYEKDDLYQSLDRTTTWIENCDTKTSVVISGIGIIAAIILSSDYITKIKSIIKYMIDNLSFWTAVFLLITAIALVFCISGCYHLYRVLVPRVDTGLYKEKGLNSESLIYFLAISKRKSFIDYKSELEKCSENNLINDIISQIYICSKICSQKFDYYTRGLNLVVIGLISLGIMMIIGSIVAN